MPLTRNALRSIALLCAALSMTGCERWLVRTETVEVPSRQYVDIPPALTGATNAPAAPPELCTADDGKPTMCGRELRQWIDYGWRGALDQANRDKLLIRCLQSAAKNEPIPKECK